MTMDIRKVPRTQYSAPDQHQTTAIAYSLYELIYHAAPFRLLPAADIGHTGTKLAGMGALHVACSGRNRSLDHKQNYPDSRPDCRNHSNHQTKTSQNLQPQTDRSAIPATLRKSSFLIPYCWIDYTAMTM